MTKEKLKELEELANIYERAQDDYESICAIGERSDNICIYDPSTNGRGPQYRGVILYGEDKKKICEFIKQIIEKRFDEAKQKFLEA